MHIFKSDVGFVLVTLHILYYILTQQSSECKRGHLRCLLTLPVYVRALTCLKMAGVQAETCSTHVRAI